MRSNRLFRIAQIVVVLGGMLVVADIVLIAIFLMRSR